MKKSFIAVLVILTSGHSVVCFNDTCYYTSDGFKFLCGDICLSNGQFCDCGGQGIRAGSYEYCCALASACNSTRWGASCSSGEVLDFWSPTPCNATGKCFNDVLTSQHISFWAKYTCQDKCITWEDMCQGHLCAGHEEACGPQLRCPADKYNPPKNPATQYNMSTTPVRHYCFDKCKPNCIPCHAKLVFQVRKF